MNTADLAKEIARREALATAWSQSAKELRADLDAKARAEYDVNGCGVTWKWRDLGRVTLPLTEEVPYIADIAALLAWVKERHPEHVETVEQVRAAFQTWLLLNVEPTGTGRVFHRETGEVIPGMAMREGGKPKALSITIDKPVKELFAEYARQQVKQALVAEYGEAVSDVDA